MWGGWLVVLVLGQASGQRPTWVDFRAPQECPTAERFSRELLFRTNRVVLVTEEPLATARVSIDLERRGKRFRGRLVIRTSSGEAISREVESPRCESVTTALGLATALVLDPEGAKMGAVPAALPPIIAPVVEPRVTPVEPTEQPRIEEKPRVEETPRLEEKPTSVVEAPPVPEPREPGAFTLVVLATGHLTNAVSAHVEVGGGLAVQAELRPTRGALFTLVSLGVAFGSGRTISNATGSIRYPNHLDGRADLGVGWVFGLLRAELRLSTHVVQATVSGLGADEVSSSARWLVDLGPAAHVVVVLGSVRLGAWGGVGVPLVPERYVIEPNGAVAAVPGVAAAAGLQLGVRLFE